MEQVITKTGSVRYLTTENPEKFKESAQVFLHEQVKLKSVSFDQFLTPIFFEKYRTGYHTAEPSYYQNGSKDDDDVPAG